MRTLAIDLVLGGSASPSATPAASWPRLTMSCKARLPAIDGILKVIEAEEVQRIVVGLPLNMDGTRGPAANEAVEFGRHLSAHSGTTVIFVDERLSTFQAEQDLSVRRRGGEKITRKSKKRRLDALAAAQFLQEFLDGKLEAIDF